MKNNLTSWKYNKNKDYSLYYGKECIVTVNYGLMNQWRHECIKHYGLLAGMIYLKDDDESVTVSLNNGQPQYNVCSTLITNIELNYTNQSILNLNKLKDFIILKLGNDIFEEVKKFLLPDLISI